MKKLYKYIVLVVSIIALVACTDDVEFPNVSVEEGTDVTLTLKVQTESNKDVVVSRATDDENKLYDLHIYVFEPTREVDGNITGGNLIGYKKLVFDGYIPPTLENGNTVPQTISVSAISGEAYIYALANIETKAVTYYLEYSDQQLLTDPFTYGLTKQQLENINFSRVYPKAGESFSAEPTNSTYMMSGYLNDGNMVRIDTEGRITGGDGIIKLYRLLSKNTLTIGSTKGKFTPKTYRLCNVPQSGQLVPNANISTANGESDNYSYKTTNADVESRFLSTFGTPDENGRYEITFFYPENLRNEKNAEQVAASQANIAAQEKVEYKEDWVWKDRETNKWDPTRTEKKFIFADDKAAYIEIQGDYEYKETKTEGGKTVITKEITASVTYTIHLGNFTANLKDFNVIRNNHYTYSVSVNGIDDIEAEAKITNNTDNPYVEGLVIDVAKGEHLDVDAHYEARVLKFTRQSIIDLKGAGNNGTGYILNIKTPFGQTSKTINVRTDGIYDMNGNPICSIAEVSDPNENKNFFLNTPDFNWIKFVRNGAQREDGEDGTNILVNEKTHTCRYPGDNKNRYTYNNSGVQQEVYAGGWMNVFELLAELYYTKTKTADPADVYGDDGEVYYTCFIDENYYPKEEWKDYVSWPDEVDGKKEPRTMLIANKLNISTDHKSVYAEVQYSISQRPISTFYTATDSMALGTEIIDEEKKFNGRFQAAWSSYSYEAQTIGEIKEADDSKAWNSANKTNVGKGWYDNVNSIENIQPLYTRAAKACMSRNRDLDGDGYITYNANDPSKNEVRWYLAGIEQYRALTYGQTSLDVDARLMNETDLGIIASSIKSKPGHNERVPYHYFTCSGGIKTTFWPEESLTNNPTDSWSRAELVRCVRTLESGSIDSPGYGTKEHELYYTPDKDTITLNNVEYTRYTFILNGIESTRGPIINEPTPVHNEIEEFNNLSSCFVVAVRDLNVKQGDSDGYPNRFNYSNITGGTDDFCYEHYAEGDYGIHTWRTPNQKEFALMISEMDELDDEDDDQYGIRTKFSGWDKARGYWDWHNETDGIWCDKGRINVGRGGMQTGGLKIRCVRDKIL